MWEEEPSTETNCQQMESAEQPVGHFLTND